MAPTSSTRDASEVVYTSSQQTLPNDQQQTPLGDRPACFKNTLQECLFVLIATSAVAQNTILAGSMRSVTALIAKDLQMDDAETTWIIAGQTLTAGTFLLFFGRVADLFGRRWLLIASMAMFSVFLLISGFATNALFFDSFMGFCGLACAAAVPPAVGTLGAVYDTPSKRKNRAFSCFGAGAPIGVIIGSWVSGIVTVITTWRAILWVLATIYAALASLAWLVVPKYQDQDQEKPHGGCNTDTLAQFDMLGTFLITTGTAAITAALTEAGVADEGWATSFVIALLVVGIVLTVAFLFWERKVDHPLIPIDAWKDRNFTLLVIVLCLSYYSFSSNTFWLTLSWQNVYNDTALEIAIKFLPAAIGGLLICAIASMIIHKVGNRYIATVAAISMVIACALLSATSTHISYWALTFPALLFSVISQDFQFCVTNLYVVSCLPKEQRSVAGGLIQTTSRLAATIGLGIQTSVFKAVGGDLSGPRSTYYRAYQAAMWLSLGGAVFSLFFLPFLTLETQGNPTQEDGDAEKAERPPAKSRE